MTLNKIIIYLAICATFWGGTVAAAVDLSAAMDRISSYVRDYHYTKAAKKIKNLAAEHKGELGTTQLFFFARSLHESKRVKEAIKYYKQVIKDTDFLLADRAYYQLAQAYINRGQHKKAIATLKQFRKKFRSSDLLYDSYLALAECYQIQKKYKQAISVYKMAIKELPDKSAAMSYKIGKTLEKRGKYEQAQTHYRKLIKHYPSSRYAVWSATRIARTRDKLPKKLRKYDAEELFERGMLYFKGKNYLTAAAEFNKFVNKYTKDKRHARALFMRAQSYQKKYWYTKAIELYRELVKNRAIPTEIRAEAQYELGMIWRARKNFRIMSNHFTTLLAEYPKSKKVGPALYYLGRYQFGAGKSDAGIATFNKLIDGYPFYRHVDDAHWYVAVMQLRLGRSDQAQDVFERITRRYPKSKHAIAARFWLGKIAVAAKNDDFAINYFRQVRQEDPNSFFAGRSSEQLGLIYQRNNSFLEPDRLQRYYRIAAENIKDNQVKKALEAIDMIWQEGPISEYYGQSFGLIEQINKTQRQWPFPEFSAAGQTGFSFVPNAYATESPGGYVEQYNLLWSIGLREDAIAGLERVLRKSKKNNEAIYLLAHSYKAEEKFNKSIRMAEKLYRNLQYQERDLRKYPSNYLELLYPRYFSEHVETNAKVNKVDPLIIYALIREESRFRYNARSWAAANGLMQIIMPTARLIARDLKMGRITRANLNKPPTNIKMGVYYFKTLVDRSKGEEIKALASYNGGPKNTERWQRICADPDDADQFVSEIKFTETNKYVRRVMKSYFMYRDIYLHPATIN